MSGAFILPTGNVQIAFSGGRTSAYMLHQILETNGGLPSRARVVFSNTGREMPETLNFIEECSERWRVPIVWVERSKEGGVSVVNRENASVEGEPFVNLVRRKGYLPNSQSRYCTIELKGRATRDYLRSIGWEHWTAALGIRADEPKRVNRKRLRERWQRWYPLADAGVTKSDISEFWSKQPFSLRLATVNGETPLGNCDGCFLKSQAKRAALIREYPERAAFWEGLEALAASLGAQPSGCQFNKRWTWRGDRQFVEQNAQWAFDATDVFCQADGGECSL